MENALFAMPTKKSDFRIANFKSKKWSCKGEENKKNMHDMDLLQTREFVWYNHKEEKLRGYSKKEREKLIESNDKRNPDGTVTQKKIFEYISKGMKTKPVLED